eukprot:TRINITY_DN15347_c0_g1_i1.p1 TRINITY_DN15347_c0_g1~~TRINITY_DN15347_c0_g1_i1.p1  ORF type:complete len:391 (-),score=125.24 TRINITY_DN15347_c0_g1_i1:169-1341(-)
MCVRVRVVCVIIFIYFGCQFLYPTSHSLLCVCSCLRVQCPSSVVLLKTGRRHLTRTDTPHALGLKSGAVISVSRLDLVSTVPSPGSAPLHAVSPPPQSVPSPSRTARAPSPPASVPASVAGSAKRSNAKISVRVDGGKGPDGKQLQAVTFKILRNHPMQLVYDKYADLKRLTPGEFVLLHDGNVIKPEHTPEQADLDDSSLITVAESLDGVTPAPPRTPAAPVSPPDGLASASKRNAVAKISVRIDAGKDADGKQQPLVTFKILRDHPMQLVYDQYAGLKRLKPSEVLLLHDGRAVRPDQTGEQAGLEDMALLTVTESFSIQVQGFDTKLNFKVKMTTPLYKLMMVFSQQNKISDKQVQFDFEGRILQPDDTPGRVGLCPGSVIIASPIP